MPFLSKHILLTVTVLVYLFSTVGISFVSHYCGGELQEISVYVSPDNCCGEEEPEDDGCCHNETDHVMLLQDVMYSAGDISIKQPVSELFLSVTGFVSDQLQFTQSSLSVLFYDIPPPDVLRENLISTTVLRI